MMGSVLDGRITSKLFIEGAIGQLGKRSPPSGEYKKFTRLNSDLILTWNYELGTLSFKDEMGGGLKELFINVRTTDKSLVTGHLSLDFVTSNHDV